MRRLATIGLLIIVVILGLLGTALPASDTPEYEAYAVQANQTFTSIAEEYGISAAVLAKFNKSQVDAPLKAGQIILVPLDAELVPQTTITVNSETLPAKSVPQLKAGENQVVGTLATVSAKSAQITTKPNGDKVLFANLAQGTDLLVVDQTSTHYGVLMSNGTVGWIPRLAVSLSGTQMVVDKPKPVAKGDMGLIDTAYEYIGIPYKYGGKLPDSLDCSLFVQTVFSRHGVKLPRTAAQQMQVGTPIDTSELLPGDRLYFYDSRHAKIGHTGIYIGNDRFIHASSNLGQVGVSNLSEKTYQRKYAGARR